jgi:8-oxo-dGTP pyrophosphatase MutT (NUDIX family)
MTMSRLGAATVLPRRSAVWRDAVAVLSRYEPLDPEQEALRRAFLDVLADDTGVFKSGPPVHLTASCLVLDESGERVILGLHAKAGAWMQFGGHLEVDDPSVHAAAVREVLEESGVHGVDVDPRVVDLHRHALGARFGRCTERLDGRFGGWAPAGAQPVCSPESEDVRWWPIGGLPEDVVDDLGALVDRARARTTARRTRDDLGR